jgi:hypothetical protein
MFVVKYLFSISISISIFIYFSLCSLFCFLLILLQTLARLKKSDEEIQGHIEQARELDPKVVVVLFSIVYRFNLF